MPCRRTLDCWAPIFPVAMVLQRLISPDEWKACFEAPPPSRIDRIVERIDAAKALQEEK